MASLFISRGGAAQLAVVLAAFVAANGCDKAAPPTQVAEAEPDTPEDRLKSVMRRLEHLLEQAKPAAGSGVVSRRRCSYEMLEPTGDGEDYTANVTIETSRSVDPAVIEPPSNGQSKEGQKEDAASHPVAIGDPNDTPITAAAASTVERKVYKLAFKNRRWELVDPPYEDMPETEKLCFASALSDG